jgi:uncharacterized DUF497 family protein
MFDWNHSNIDHIAQHGITPSEAEQVVLNNPIDLEFQRRGEESRIAQIGETDQGRVLVVVTTLRNGLTRVVTRISCEEVIESCLRRSEGKET